VLEIDTADSGKVTFTGKSGTLLLDPLLTRKVTGFVTQDIIDVADLRSAPT
jgi:hypothetical protein